MQSSPARPRSSQLDRIAEALPQRATTISRLLIARTSLPVSRTEAGVMRALSTQPRRITDLAAQEGISQPGITLLVNRLQERGWVTREPDPGDRRVVLVRLTELGDEVFGALRAEYRALFHEQMGTLSDDEVQTLARAIEILDGMIERLERPRAGAPA
jgi:DNA-binding MarR family transcriptional regulator